MIESTLYTFEFPNNKLILILNSLKKYLNHKYLIEPNFILCNTDTNMQQLLKDMSRLINKNVLCTHTCSVAKFSRSQYTPCTVATSLLCPQLSPWVCSNSCPLNQMLPNHLILSRPLLLLSSSVFPSIRGFSHEFPLCIMWLEYWSLSFSISPSNEYSGLILFRPSLWFKYHIWARILEKP